MVGAESAASDRGESSLSLRELLYGMLLEFDVGKFLSGFDAGSVCSLSGLAFAGDFSFGRPDRGSSSDSIELCRRDGGRDGGRETTISRPFSPELVNMLCRFTRMLRPEADRRLARSMNVAPVEFERLDKLPNCFPSVGAVLLDRRMLEIDMHRLAPLDRSFTGLA